jgi:eukaryotic-like serine/threonine-protein kinase
MRRLLDVLGFGRQEPRLDGRVVAHRFRLIESLGDEGLGERFLATDEANEEPVILLLLPADFAGPRIIPELVRLDLNLGDPRILRAHDCGVDEEGRPFTVTRAVKGEPLSKLLAHGVLRWSESFELIEGLAELLAGPHRRGLAHGCLEPGRVLVGEGGPWLVDFGLAQALTRASGRLSLTHSACYVAPELLEGHPPSPLADLYSLGVILWEMVAGAPPFCGALNEIIADHRSGRLPELVRQLDAPVEIEALLGIALATEPDGRFADTLELLETLRGIDASSSGVWSLSSLSCESTGRGLAPTTDLGTLLRTLSVVELRATRELIDKLLAARGE